MKKGLRVAWLPFVAGAGPAFAHSPVPGIEGFYLGLLHPFSTPPQALLMVGLGLVVGGFPSETGRWLQLNFLIVSLAGLLLGVGVVEIDATMFAVAFGSCALAAVAPGRLMPLAIVLVSVGAFLIGDASIPDGGPVRDRIFTMSGSLVGANLGLLYLYGLSLVIRERYKWPWVAIAFRIAAAWVGAISLLMLALGFAGVAPPA